MKLTPHLARLALLAASLLPLGVTAAPEPAATVAAVQQAAWVERDGQQRALSPGQPLQQGDILYTGKDARLILNLPDQSTLKLGENLHLQLSSYTPASESGGVMRAVIDLLKGAFRYTASASDAQRDITVNIDSIALGIRGTDVWGKAACRQFGKVVEHRRTACGFRVKGS